MHPTAPRPAFDRISALTALILLTYGLVRMMTLPSVEAELALFGLLIKIEFRPQSVMLLLAAALAAAGSEWLIKRERSQKLTFEHWVIPSFAAIAIGFIVMRIPSGPQLWLGLVMGAILLVAVLTAEFIVSLEGDPRRDNIAIALRGLAFLLLTGSFYAMYEIQLRAIFAIPLMMIMSSLIAWRLFRLAFPDIPLWTWASLLGILSAQLGVGLHYYPLSPLVTSLLLGMVNYVLYGLILTHVEGGISRKHIIEYVAIALISLLVITTLE